MESSVKQSMFQSQPEVSLTQAEENQLQNELNLLIQLNGEMSLLGKM